MSAKIFLGGTLKTPWRQKVMAALPGATFFDPNALDGLPVKETARRELGWIRESDWCFFFFREGQKGRCSAFEMGAAHVLGRPIIYVDNPIDPWIEEFAFATTDLDHAIGYLGERIGVTCGNDPQRLPERLRGERFKIGSVLSYRATQLFLVHGRCCIYCGLKFDERFEFFVQLAVEHIVPQQTNGVPADWVWDLANCVPVCQHCNALVVNAPTKKGPKIAVAPINTQEDFLRERDRLFIHKKRIALERREKEKQDFDRVVGRRDKGRPHDTP